MWIVTVLLVLIAPFFLYVFAPLLKTNIWLGALSGGAYIGLHSPQAPARWRPISNG